MNDLYAVGDVPVGTLEITPTIDPTGYQSAEAALHAPSGESLTVPAQINSDTGTVDITWPGLPLSEAGLHQLRVTLLASTTSSNATATLTHEPSGSTVTFVRRGEIVTATAHLTTALRTAGPWGGMIPAGFAPRQYTANLALENGYYQVEYGVAGTSFTIYVYTDPTAPAVVETMWRTAQPGPGPGPVGRRRIANVPVIVEDHDSGWYTVDSAIADHADFERLGEMRLFDLLESAKTDCIAFAVSPERPAPSPIPSGWRIAQMVQARDRYDAALAASSANGDEIGGMGFAIPWRPMEAKVKQLLRPATRNPRSIR